ncbi:dGTPase [Pseudomonas sp. EpS/L25]|uniref:dGTPase n=1 Tax=Pseudomonas sp. EpS/L25 TaxID=1749078 RepID=UPI00080294A2|nr:dGTPase [Pseudomonas sp. EpS/L25]
MSYKKFISEKRLRKSTSEREKNLIIETESDKARIIFSAPFRRLQKKAQVFPLEQNAAVRSRLTHSLEVSTIGRQISQKIVRKIESLSHEEKEAFVNIVESACLLHDIGNPPFGHFGEAAISKWFKNAGNGCYAHHKNEHPDWYSDLEKFEGNAQGLRIITKLQSEDDYGLNLTCSAICAYLKYTYPEHERKKQEENPSTKKNGYFLSESTKIQGAWKKLRIPPHNRHPLNFVMEAADDIAYCLSDIEDGIEKKLTTIDELIAHIKSELKKGENAMANDAWIEILTHASKEKMPTNKFISIRTNLINRSTTIAAEHYIKREDDILKFRFSESLIDERSAEYIILNIIRKFVSEKVYTAREAEILELAGDSAISGILEKFKPLLDLPKSSFDALLEKDRKIIKSLNLDIEKRLLNLIPKQCIKTYNHEKDSPLEWYYRAHLIIDYISGMTDDFALEIYQKLSGIRVL